MSDTDYESLALTAKLLVKSQLDHMSTALKKGPLAIGHSKMLLEIAEWLSEMSLLEKEEFESMTPEEKERLREREKKRAQRMRLKREHSNEAQGDQETEGGKGQKSPKSAP